MDFSGHCYTDILLSVNPLPIETHPLLIHGVVATRPPPPTSTLLLMAAVLNLTGGKPTQNNDFRNY